MDICYHVFHYRSMCVIVTVLVSILALGGIETKPIIARRERARSELYSVSWKEPCEGFENNGTDTDETDTQQTDAHMKQEETATDENSAKVGHNAYDRVNHTISNLHRLSTEAGLHNVDLRNIYKSFHVSIILVLLFFKNLSLKKCSSKYLKFGKLVY